MTIANMASKEDGHVRSEVPFLQDSRAQNSIGAKSSDFPSAPTSGVLTEPLNCENCDEGDDFVQVFTSQSLSAVSISYVSGYNGDSSSHIDYFRHDSQQSHLQTQTSSNNDVAFIRNAELLGLPKDIYIGKLLEICLHNENQVCWGNFSAEKPLKVVQVFLNMQETVIHDMHSLKVITRTSSKCLTNNR